MSIQPETLLQRRIQRVVRSRGGYIHKNHGSMISEPGIADLWACYRGLFLAIETKEDGNHPSPAQGIHCRQVKGAGGIPVVAWGIDDVVKVLDAIDLTVGLVNETTAQINAIAELKGVDDGTDW